MSPKLKLRLTPLAQPSPSEPPRNSFTITDYYRTTREEIYSPVSRVESLSPSSLPQTSPTRLEHIREGSDPNISDEGEADEQRTPKRTAAFWHVFGLFRKWRRQKDKEGRARHQTSSARHHTSSARHHTSSARHKTSSAGRQTSSAH